VPYIALYRKWRPQTFDEVVEQSSIVTILKNTVKTGRIAHAYLFCGTRGTGKTSMAEIFARAINCLEPQDGNPCNKCEICRGILEQRILDVTEIDAASNNGVDNIRDITEESIYAAAQAKYRVYIIDEVHMLSTGAFNALLKTLEEPPNNVVFILATTEPHRLPATILSRCQRFDFKRISRAGIIERLVKICEDLNIEYEKSALGLIAQKADGALRDAINLLDQAISSSQGKITVKSVRDASGSIDREFLERFTEKLLRGDSSAILQFADTIFSEGRDPSNFLTELMGILRDMLIVMTVRNPESMLFEDEQPLTRLKELADMTTSQELGLIIRELSKLDNSLKWAVQRKIIFEIGLLRLSDKNFAGEHEELIERINVLENRLNEFISSGIRNSMPVQQDEPRIQNNEDVSSCKAKSGGTSKSQSDNKTQTKSIGDNKGVGIVMGDLDWVDFISAISDNGKVSISNIIKINSKAYVFEPDVIYLVFENKAIFDMISKPDIINILNSSASRAMNSSYAVHCVMKNEFEKLDPEQKNEAEKTGPDEFTKALDMLEKMSLDEGFVIEEKD
jgi:DNA polymerase-3 subunit gamma/tau